jgi:hypothetical protein
MVDYAIEPAAGQLTLFYHPPTLRVTRREELPTAFAQREKQIVIENPDIAKLFAIAEFWRTVRFLGLVVGFVICFAIALKYKIESGWQYHMQLLK